MAASLGYDAGLLSLGALKDASVDELIDHCRSVADTMLPFGFYLKRSRRWVSVISEFWQRFVEIPNAVAIKIAALNRYQTFEVVRAVAEAGRAGDIALYTGNDDNILLDLVTEYAISTSAGVQNHIFGGLRSLGGLDAERRRHAEEARRFRDRETDIPSKLSY